MSSRYYTRNSLVCYHFRWDVANHSIRAPRIVLWKTQLASGITQSFQGNHKTEGRGVVLKETRPLNRTDLFSFLFQSPPFNKSINGFQAGCQYTLLQFR